MRWDRIHAQREAGERTLTLRETQPRTIISTPTGGETPRWKPDGNRMGGVRARWVEALRVKIANEV